MSGLEKQLSNVLGAFNGKAKALTTEEKVQAFYAHSLGNDESKLEKLLKSGVSLEDVKKKIHQFIVDSVKEDEEEQPDWKAQAKELLTLLKSDQAEQVKAKIEQSGETVKDILDGVLQKALDESDRHNSKGYCLDYMVPTIELGANPNLQEKGDWTAMIVAARYVEQPDAIIQRMLDKGADPNLQQEKGWTAMMVAARHVEQPDAIIQMLLDKGADPNLQEVDGWTAMMVAARYVKQPDAIIQMLLDKGAAPNLQTKDGMTSLMFVAQYVEQPDAIIQMLLDKGADPNLKDKYGRTTMMLAAQYVEQPDAIIQMLLDKGADPNLKDKYGRTTMMLAARYVEQPDAVIRILLDKGADPNLQTKNGWTVVKIAKHKNKKQTVRLLKSAIRKYKHQERREKAKAFLSFNR